MMISLLLQATIKAFDKVCPVNLLIFLRPSFTLVPVEDLHWYWGEVVLKARPTVDIQQDDEPGVVRKKELLVRSLNKFPTYPEDTYLYYAICIMLMIMLM